MFDADDDELDFAPSAASKLASVFNLEKSKQDGNQSLVYTPPKKPKPVDQVTEAQPQNATSKPPAAMPRFSVVIADIVHSFKLDAGVYTDQRKVGVAILGNAQALVFQVLLYKTSSAGKQDYIAVAKISQDFRFLVQPKFYCSFYDDAKNYWSIVFNCQDACMQFARQIGAAHFRALHGKAVVTQMIDPGDEGSLKGVTTHLTISQQYFDIASVAPYNPVEATIKVSVNTSQEKWTEGLVDANPGSRWAIFIPASTALPWSTEMCISPLVLEVNVEKVLHATPSPAAEPVKDKFATSSEEGSVQSKGASLTESLSNMSSAKANLISRVARMGQQTLPLKGAVFSNPTDSEDTEEENSSVASSTGKPGSGKPPLKPKFSKGRSSGARHPSSESDQAFTAKTVPPLTSTLWRPAAVVNSDNKMVQYVSGDGQVPINSASQPYHLMASSPATSPSEPVSMFISEARMQNTEMRMNMNRIMDKIDNLSNKVDALPKSSPSRAAAPAPALSAGMDASTLLSSIEKLVKDNQSLATEVAEKNEKLRELNERIFTLVDNNAKILDQNRVLLEEKQTASNKPSEAQMLDVQKKQIEMLESEKSSLIAKVAQLEKMTEVLEDSNSGLKISAAGELSDKDSQLSRKESDLSAKLLELKLKDSELKARDAEVDSLRSSLTVKEDALKAALTELDELRSSIDEKVKAVQEKAARYEGDNAELQIMVTSLSTNIAELENTIATLQTSHQEEKTAFETKIQTYEETIPRLKSEFGAGSKHEEHDVESSVMDLKLLMNRVYRKISQYFDGTRSMSGAVVRQTVAVILKSEVTQYTEELLLRKNRAAVRSDAVPESAVASAVKVPVESPAEVPTESSGSLEREELVGESVKPPPEEPPTNVAFPNAEPKTEDRRPQNEFWRSDPPPVPKFEDEEDNEDWLNL